MMRRDRQRSSQMLCHSRQNDGLGGGQKRRKVVMVRNRAAVVREAAIGVLFGLGRFDPYRSGRILMVEMERREQLEADVPNEYEQ